MGGMDHGQDFIADLQHGIFSNSAPEMIRGCAPRMMPMRRAMLSAVIP
jgi:hypothetical protein